MKFSTLIGNYINNPKIQKTFRKKITERLPCWIFVLHFTKYWPNFQWNTQKRYQKL